MRQKTLCFTLATICGSVIFVGSFHLYDTYADLASLRPLFRITDARNYLIVVIREIPHIISFPRIIGRNQLWLLNRSAAKLVRG